MQVENTILFVCEGGVDEPKVIKRIAAHFNLTCKQIIIVFASDIHQLYRAILRDTDLTLIDLLRDRNEGALKDISNSSISEIYLFFDSDLHASSASSENLEAMLDIFCDETSDHGKLYISYPMLQAWKHLKKDTHFDFNNLIYSLRDNSYKEFSADNSDFNYINGTTFDDWLFISKKNIIKANYLINDIDETPSYKQYLSCISQKNIFKSQNIKHIPNKQISVLSAFPFFITEYFGEQIYGRILNFSS